MPLSTPQPSSPNCSNHKRDPKPPSRPIDKLRVVRHVEPRYSSTLYNLNRGWNATSQLVCLSLNQLNHSQYENRLAYQMRSQFFPADRLLPPQIRNRFAAQVGFPMGL